MTPDSSRLSAALEATWPPARLWCDGAAVLRDGAGGGKRVSAATLTPDWRAEDLDRIEAAMEQPLVRLPAEATDLEAALADRGYARRDPSLIRLGPVAPLTDRPVPRVTAFSIWEPLAIMREIWAEGGIGPERLAVMERASPPKTAIFGRIEDTPSGAAFVAVSDGIAVVHAAHVRSDRRRKGLAGWMMRQAAHWAAGQGAEWLACCVTEANAPANALYASLGLEIAARYHYREGPAR